jgi:hypothetical protein
MGGAYNTNGRNERCTQFFFFLENLKERDNLEDLAANGRIILRYILRKLGERLGTGFVWFRTWSSGGIL